MEQESRRVLEIFTKGMESVITASYGRIGMDDQESWRVLGIRILAFVVFYVMFVGNCFCFYGGHKIKESRCFVH